jgi:hypothetical protein
MPMRGRGMWWLRFQKAEPPFVHTHRALKNVKIVVVDINKKRSTLKKFFFVYQ